MLILVSGSTRTVGEVAREDGMADYLGHLLTPKTGNAPASLPLRFAADNGAFGGFEEEGFRRMLVRIAPHKDRCLWVNAPDVLGNARKTLELWPVWRAEIARHGLRPCFVLQDGQESLPLPTADAYFIGGSTRFKLGIHARQLAQEAKAAGAWLHMGRVNTLRRLRTALDYGCDSVDGTCFSRWGDVFLRWAVVNVRAMEKQPLLFG